MPSEIRSSAAGAKSDRLKARPTDVMKLKCPICRKPVDSDSTREFPFCSATCRARDLGNWATEKYKVAVRNLDESEPDETETNERIHSEPSEDGE